MRTDRYLLRALKYFVLLIVLIVVLYALAYYFEGSPMSVEEYVAMLIADPRAKWLLPVFGALALAYPAFGYMTRSLPISLEQNRVGVDAAMRACDFALAGERDGVLLYRATSTARRVRLMWEDELEVWSEGDRTMIRGHRAAVVQVIYRSEIYMRKENGEEL